MNEEIAVTLVFMGFLILVVCLSMYASIGTSSNVDFLRENETSYFATNGMEIVVREGFHRTPTWFLGNHGGGTLRYQVKRTNHPEVIYRCSIRRWGKDNIQLQNMKPVGNYMIIDGSAPVTIMNR